MVNEKRVNYCALGMAAFLDTGKCIFSRNIVNILLVEANNKLSGSIDINFVSSKNNKGVCVCVCVCLILHELSG